ncbi:MAG: antitoxin [Jatrophihabitans sp.]
MGFDELKNRAEGLLHEHQDQVSDGVDKAADLLKDKVSGHDEQIDKAEDFLKGKLGNL